MVTDQLLRFAGTVLGWFFGLDPRIPVPEWVTSNSTTANMIFGTAQVMQVWLPLRLLFTIGYVLLLAIVLSFVLKVGRIFLSVFTAGGGSAG